jgi:hypothetical protein
MASDPDVALEDEADSPLSLSLRSTLRETPGNLDGRHSVAAPLVNVSLGSVI